MSFCHCVTRSTPPAAALVRKLVSVLESIEKLPVYTYDSPGTGYGLQVNHSDSLPAFNFYSG